MGNRAVISVNTNNESPSIYLHWNGGPESVLAFLSVAKELGVPDPATDEQGFIDGMYNLIDKRFFKGSSVYRQPIREADCDNRDNGHYVVGKDFAIERRLHSLVHHADGQIKLVDHLDDNQLVVYNSIREMMLEA